MGNINPNDIMYLRGYLNEMKKKKWSWLGGVPDCTPGVDGSAGWIHVHLGLQAGFCGWTGPQAVLCDQSGP